MTKLLTIVAGLALVGALSVIAPPALAEGPTLPTFAVGALPPAPDLGLQRNEDAEPGLAVDGSGTFWAASNILPFAADDRRNQGGVLSGSDVYKSSNGRDWTWVAAPFQPMADQGGLGGEDTDIAVAPEKNGSEHYMVYVASLYVGSTNVAISGDGGATWRLVPFNGEPVQDRPWLSADGPCIFYMAYHAIAPYDTVVNKYDACNLLDQTAGSAVTPTPVATFVGNIAPGLTNRFGKQVVDNSRQSPFRHRMYVPMQGCDYPVPPGSPSEAGPSCHGEAYIFVGVSDDGMNFTNHQVALMGATKEFIWPATAAVDDVGTVYVAWFTGKDSYINSSRDGGVTWSPKVRINAAPSLSSVYPTLAAGAAGVVEAAWYGTDRAGLSDDVKVMGKPNESGAAKWRLYWAQSTDYGKTWHQTAVSDTLHTGVLCTSGGGCGVYPGDRNLLDDFGLAMSPVGKRRSAVVYDNDQPQGDSGHTFTAYAGELAAAAATPSVPKATPNTAGFTPWSPLPVLALLALIVGVAPRLTSYRKRRDHRARARPEVR